MPIPFSTTFGTLPHISHDKATRELDYQPRPFRETIRDTLAWFADNGRLKTTRIPPTEDRP